MRNHGATRSVDEARLATLLPLPAIDANKYTRGVLTLVAGSAEYPGAACLAARAAGRIGAGYVQVFCAPESVSVLRNYLPSLVVRSWDDHLGEKLPRESSDHPAACLLGSGFAVGNDELNELALEVVRTCEAPLVIDGGALSALASEEGLRAAKERAAAFRTTVLTPHSGEALRLGKAVFADSPTGYASFQRALADGRAKMLSEAFKALVVLKGPQTYISDGEAVVVMSKGTPALAKAGTGDVLAGMIGALLAQGLVPQDAAELGCTLHAEAGRLAASALTEISTGPEDVIDALPSVLARWLAL